MLIYVRVDMFRNVFWCVYDLGVSISVPASLGRPQKNIPLEIWIMYVVYFVDLLPLAWCAQSLFESRFQHHG